MEYILIEIVMIQMVVFHWHFFCELYDDQVQCYKSCQRKYCFCKWKQCPSKFPLAIACLQLKFYPRDEKVRTINQETNMLLQKQNWNLKLEL